MSSLQVSVVTLFPQMFEAVTEYGICQQAVNKGLLDVQTANPRDFANNKHRTVDDRPYGGGPGMLMMPEPLSACIDDVRRENTGPVIYLSPQGERMNQSVLESLAVLDSMVLLCGRYEGVDERILESRVDREISIGDFVLAGGEFAAMVLIEGIVRLRPGVLGNAESALQDSFSDGLLDHPHYTRPDEFEGCEVPPVLMSGDHEQIRLWRLKQSLKRTRDRRPDLLQGQMLTVEQIEILNALDSEQSDE